MSDEELFAAVAQGDRTAFAAFYDRHFSSVFRFATRILRDSELAEEVTQDAFVSLWRHRASYDSTRASPGAWLRGIVRHRATDCWRTERRRPRLVDNPEQRFATMVAPDDTETLIVAREQRREFVARLADLPVAQREVVALSYYGGLTHSEIAHELKLPAGTAKGRIRLGVNRMRADMRAEQLKGLRHREVGPGADLPGLPIRMGSAITRPELPDTTVTGSGRAGGR